MTTAFAMGLLAGILGALALLGVAFGLACLGYGLPSKGNPPVPPEPYGDFLRRVRASAASE